MGQAIWIPKEGEPGIIYTGHIEFRDIPIPVPGKDPWGMDTLTRTMQGPGHLYEAFRQSLAQGQTFGGFALQSWKPTTDKSFPGFVLTYKWLNNGIPDPLISNSRSELCSTITATDLSVTFNGKTITSAQKEVKYEAPQTTYRYITESEPTGPKYNAVRGTTSQSESALKIIDSRTTVTFSDGTTQLMMGNTPAGVATALATTPEVFVIGPSANPVPGTSYWECEDVCQLKYPG